MNDKSLKRRKVLVVDDEERMVRFIRLNLEQDGFIVVEAFNGKQALQRLRDATPDLILLDIMMPDLDGFEVLQMIREINNVPVIMLTAKGEEDDRVRGLELGADDYITKPFDIEELKLRVQGAIRRSERESLTDPRSGLPAGRLIEEQLCRTIREAEWAYMDIRINYFDQFRDVYGFVAGDDVLRFTAMLIGEVVDELGTVNDFIGHAGGDNFIIVTTESAAPDIRQRLRERFSEEIQTHYNFMDRQQGFIVTPNAEGEVEKTPLMSLAIGIVTPKIQTFADIREITEMAAESRRQDTASAVSKG